MVQQVPKEQRIQRRGLVAEEEVAPLPTAATAAATAPAAAFQALVEGFVHGCRIFVNLWQMPASHSTAYCMLQV